MAADRTELCDVGDKFPQERERLVALHADWSRQLGIRQWDELIAMPQAGRFRGWQEDDAERRRRITDSRIDQ